MGLPVHLHRDHSQVLNRQEVFMLARPVLGFNPQCAVFDIHKRPLAMRANENRRVTFRLQRELMLYHS